MRIAVIGLGKIGLCLAAFYASRGHSVAGVDIDRDKVKRVNAGESPIDEPGLSEAVFTAVRERRLWATDSYREALTRAKISFIVVNTPSQPDGSLDIVDMLKAADYLGSELRRRTGYHLVVVKSTVLPGVTRRKVAPLVRRRAGRRSIGFCFSPEFTALGRVLAGLSRPEYVLVGEVDPQAGEALERFYRAVYGRKGPPIVRASAETVEAAKYLSNAYFTMKIAFANAAADMCQHIPGADGKAALGILGLDSRIGARQFSPGLGFGGPYFPKDLAQLLAYCASIGYGNALWNSIAEENAEHGKRVVRLIRSSVKGLEGKRVAVLGVAYKPGTSLTTESPARLLIEDLWACKDVSVHDPAAGDGTPLEKCLDEADCAVVAVPWPEYEKLTPEFFARHMKKGAVVVDLWRIYNPETFRGRLRYVGLGLGR